MHNGSTWRHSVIVANFKGVSTTLFDALVTGRTSSTSYNNNQNVYDIYPDKARRILKLTGNYNQWEEE